MAASELNYLNFTLRQSFSGIASGCRTNTPLRLRQIDQARGVAGSGQDTSGQFPECVFFVPDQLDGDDWGASWLRDCVNATALF